MLTFTQRLLLDVKRVRKAMGYGPEIQANFAHAGLATTLAVIFCLLDDGVDDVDAIYSYLAERGSKYDSETIESLLEAFDGNDPRYHLWTRLPDDDYGSLAA